MFKETSEKGKYKADKEGLTWYAALNKDGDLEYWFDHRVAVMCMPKDQPLEEALRKAYQIMSKNLFEIWAEMRHN